MQNTKHIGYLWGLAVAAGIGIAIAHTPAVASADSGKSADAGKGSTSSESSKTGDSPRHQPHPKKAAVESAAATSSTAPVRKHDGVTSHPTPKPKPKSVVVKTTPPADPAPAVVATPALTRSALAPVADQDFITSTHGFFGLFSVTSAADPDDNHFVAFVLRTPFFTDVLTSGTDPENNLGLGRASLGVAGHTVNTFIGPFVNFSFAIPVTDPLAPIFTSLVRAGF
jgi:hypothetical protein